MRLLSPHEVAARTGLPYSKALMLVKAMPYLQIQKRYYVTEAALHAFLSQDSAIEITGSAN